MSRRFRVTFVAHTFATVALVCGALLSEGKPHPQRAAQACASEQAPPKQLAIAVETEDKTSELDTGTADHATKEGRDVSEVVAVWVQALAAVASLALTAWLIWYSHRGWQAADKNAAAAERSAEIAASALALSQRAWLRVELLLDGPFVCDGRTVSVRIIIRMKNFGKSPATNFGYRIALYADRSGRDVFEAFAEREKMCQALREEGTANIGGSRTVVFPGETYDHRVQFAGTLPEPRRDDVEFPTPEEMRLSYTPAIGGCVDYQFAGSGEHHQTGFMYTLWQREPDMSESRFIPFNYGPITIQPDVLHLMSHPLGGSYAD